MCSFAGCLTAMDFNASVCSARSGNGEQSDNMRGIIIIIIIIIIYTPIEVQQQTQNKKTKKKEKNE